jgi:ABC-type phosphate transport system substrate-binding protein
MAARDRSAADPPGLVFTPIARSAVCVATHSGNRLAGVTRAQLGAMAAGAITDWSQVPGATVSGPVSMWGYFDGEGAQVVFEEQLAAPGPPPFAFPALERRQTGGEIRNGVRKIEGAIGWLDLRFTTGLNVLKVDGVACSRAAVASRRYAGRRGLSLVTRGRPSGAAARFIRWARTSTVAQRIVGRTFIPVR